MDNRPNQPLPAFSTTLASGACAVAPSPQLEARWRNELAQLNSSDNPPLSGVLGFPRTPPPSRLQRWGNYAAGLFSARHPS
jgi:hypothetical protein